MAIISQYKYHILYTDPAKLSGKDRILFFHEILRTQNESSFSEAKTNEREYKLFFFNSGTRDFKIGSTVEKCGPGDIFVLAPGEVCSKRTHNTVLDRYKIYIQENAFGTFGVYGTELMRFFTDRPLHTNNRFRLPPEVASQVNMLLEDTDKILHMREENPITSIEATANIIKILVLLKQSQEEKNAPGTPSQLMLRILAYMDSNCSRLTSIEEIGQEFTISRSGLWRMFRQYMNQTPSEYLRKVRLKHARLALEQGMSVTDACLACGFTDCSRFIHLFREVYGMTPLQYKKQLGLTGENGGNT